MGYLLEGRLVEICSCERLCPCWAGLDPDNGACHLNWIFHFDHGYVDGVNMAGTNLGLFGVLVGNAKLGQGHMVGILDEKDSEEQHEVLRRALRGELGGPLGDLGKMLVEVVAIETAPIEFDISRGTGTMKAGDWFEAETEVIRTPAHRRMKIDNSPLAPVLGNPVYVCTVVHHQIHDPKYGMEFTAHTALQTDLRYVWNDKVGGFFESFLTKRKKQKD